MMLLRQSRSVLARRTFASVPETMKAAVVRVVFLAIVFLAGGTFALADARVRVRAGDGATRAAALRGC